MYLNTILAIFVKEVLNIHDLCMLTKLLCYVCLIRKYIYCPKNSCSKMLISVLSIIAASGKQLMCPSGGAVFN